MAQKIRNRCHIPSASSIDPEQLGFLAVLSDMILQTEIHHNTGGCGGWIEQKEVIVDCMQVRQLARQELIRRGLQA